MTAYRFPCAFLNDRFPQPWPTSLDRGCLKTLTKIFGQKIDRIDRSTSDDRHRGNGISTPNIYASLLDFEFLHRLGTQPNATNGFCLESNWATRNLTAVDDS
jgi:hypothetical protein